MKFIIYLTAMIASVAYANAQTSEVKEVPVLEEVVFKDVAPPEPTPSEDAIYTVVEENSTPAMGYNEFTKFVLKNLHYPKNAKKKKIEGTVFVQFIVKKDGKLTDFQVIRGIEKECDKEAINVIKKGGDWKPGKQRGQPVNQRFILPVRFKLDAVQDDKKKKD